MHPRKRIRYQTFEALTDISFAIQPGEFFGIVGRNGSGKSTLLKCIAGIYQCRGDIWVRGRLSTFIELGVGFNLDLPARDNVIVNGIMMGLSPREARKRYESVIDFAELHQFAELKLKNYSSGMLVRLGFSVAIQVDADILVIDEVLAVGDAAFQQKCFEVFHRLRDEGKTIIFVTHEMSAMQRFCHRAMLLERGVLACVGDPNEVAERYLEVNFGRALAAAGAADNGESVGDVRVSEVWLEDQEGQRQVVLAQGQRITMRVVVEFFVEIEDPQVRLELHNEDDQTVLADVSWLQHEHTGRFSPGERAIFSFSFDNVLAPRRYSPVVDVSQRGSDLDVIHRYERAFSFLVTAASPRGGLVDVPTEVSVDRITASLESEIRV